MARPRTQARRAGDLLSTALKSLGVPSMRITRRIEDAWTRAADPGWSSEARPRSLVAGVLEIGVSSSSLREELAQFHAGRLLSVLRVALPDLGLASIRFTSSTPETRR